MSDSKENEEGIASAVLGALKKPRPTRRFVVDAETASAPLAQEGTVIRTCCLGCGLCLEILESGAQRLAKFAGAEKPEFWGDHYFEVQGCPMCDRDYRGVALKRINDLAR